MSPQNVWLKGQWGLLWGDPERKSEITQLCPTLCNPMDSSLQTPSSMGYSRQEYWSGLPFPSPRDLPDPGIEPGSPTLQAASLPSEPPGRPGRPRGLWETETPLLKGMLIPSSIVSISIIVLFIPGWFFLIFSNYSLKA